MISPTEPLFAKISEAFIKEWEKEFGKCDYYLVDSFNEMDIPFPEKGNPARYEMAASYGEKVYSSIKRAIRMPCGLCRAGCSATSVISGTTRLWVLLCPGFPMIRCCFWTWPLITTGISGIRK